MSGQIILDGVVVLLSGHVAVLRIHVPSLQFCQNEAHFIGFWMAYALPVHFVVSPPIVTVVPPSSSSFFSTGAATHPVQGALGTWFVCAQVVLIAMQGSGVVPSSVQTLVVLL